MFADSVKTSLLMADCSKFLLQRRGTLGRRSWKAVSVVQPVPRSMMNAGVVDQEVQRQAAVERPPGRPAPVHGHTGSDTNTTQVFENQCYMPK